MSEEKKMEEEIEETIEEEKIEELNDLNNDQQNEVVEDYQEKYLRAIADYQNLLKQSAKEKTIFAKYAIEDFLQDIIPVYDHLKLSLQGLKDEEQNNAWVKGVQYVLNQFKTILESRGVNEIKTVGEKFDHNLMEALDGEGDIVKKEVMPGYTLNGKVIKAAKVIVENKK